MSTTNTNYQVNNQNSQNMDLVNIFQINPQGPGATTLPPPFTFTTTGSCDVSYVSGFYVLRFTKSSTLTIDPSVTSSIYCVVVGGGGGGGTDDSDLYLGGGGGGGGGVFNGTFTNDITHSPLTIVIGSGGAANRSGQATTLSGPNPNLFQVIANGGGLGGSQGHGGIYGTLILTNATNILPSSTGTSGGCGYISYQGAFYPAAFSGLNGSAVYIPPTNFVPSYFGGGGGSGGTIPFGGCGGVGGGGNGGFATGGNPIDGCPGVDYTGGGGGGASAYVNTQSNPAQGGSGTVIIYFQYP